MSSNFKEASLTMENIGQLPERLFVFMSYSPTSQAIKKFITENLLDKGTVRQQITGYYIARKSSDWKADHEKELKRTHPDITSFFGMVSKLPKKLPITI